MLSTTLNRKKTSKAVLFALLLLFAMMWRTPSAQAQSTILCGQQIVGTGDSTGSGSDFESVSVSGTVYLYARPGPSLSYWTVFQGTVGVTGIGGSGNVAFWHNLGSITFASQSATSAGGIGNYGSITNTGVGGTVLDYLMVTPAYALWNVVVTSNTFTATPGTQITETVQATAPGSNGNTSSGTIAACAAPYIYVTQSGTALTWHINGLTPNSRFIVNEQTSQNFNDNWSYTSSSTGTDSRAFNYGGGTPGDVITLSVTDTASGQAATIKYTVLSSGGGGGSGPSISVTQTSGQYPVWHISGITPDGQFSVTEAGGGSNYWVYTASSSGTDSRSFNPNGAPVGSTITLTVKDTSTGKTAQATWTLLSYP